MTAWGQGTQLSLDGVADWPVAAPPIPPRPPTGEPGRPVKPAADAQLSGPAPATGTAQSPSNAVEAVWAHPQANRQVVLGGQPIAYLLRRGQRKTIGFSVGAQGLTVSAPRWGTLAAVDAALHSKAEWVLRTLRQAGQRHHALQGQRMDWREGARLPWLGEHLELRLGQLATPDAERGGVSAVPVAARRKAALVQAHGDALWVALPPSATPAQWRDAVQAWMSHAAHAHFVQRLNHFAPLLGVAWTSLRLSSAATRWGSAKADGSIRLHWRLMQFEPAVVDYVVAHELSHLRHMDHSPRFWQTVASVVPDYPTWRARLKGERLPPW
ncbi:MAG: metal-dependent hydrolase [Polaromonas sp.]|nr:metal-dependent hydrolase [Polaromonas sp.]